MLVLLLLMVAVLLGIFVQDMLWRKVYLLAFPILLFLFVVSSFLHRRSLADVAFASVVNITFLAVQFLLVSFYFFLKNKKWVKLTGSQLGWGDILFLLTIAFYFSALNFILFYVSSLLLALVSWLIWQRVSAKPGKNIPLAGLQALVMVGFLGWDFLERSVDLTSDAWLTIKILKLL
ncbi:MAG: hypothetical protein V4456_16310 [Bacteroidota bacterium]